MGLKVGCRTLLAPLALSSEGSLEGQFQGCGFRLCAALCRATTDARFEAGVLAGDFPVFAGEVACPDFAPAFNVPACANDRAAGPQINTATMVMSI